MLRILAREKWAVHQLSLSLVTVPVTSVVCVAAINLACPNLARYYFALYSAPAPNFSLLGAGTPTRIESTGIFHRTFPLPTGRYASFIIISARLVFIVKSKKKKEEL